MAKENLQGWLVRNVKKGVNNGKHVGLEEVATKLGVPADDESVLEALNRLYGTKKQAWDVFNCIQDNDKLNKKRDRKKKTTINQKPAEQPSNDAETEQPKENKNGEKCDSEEKTEKVLTANANAVVTQNHENIAKPTVEEVEALLSETKEQFEATSKEISKISEKMHAFSKKAETLKKKADKMLQEARSMMAEYTEIAKKVSQLAEDKITVEVKIEELNEQMKQYEEQIEKLKVLHLHVPEVKDSIDAKELKEMVMTISFGEDLPEVAKNLNCSAENWHEFKEIVDDLQISDVKVLAMVLLATAKYAPRQVCWHFDKTDKDNCVPDILNGYFGMLVEYDN